MKIVYSMAALLLAVAPARAGLSLSVIKLPQIKCSLAVSAAPQCVCPCVSSSVSVPCHVSNVGFFL